MLFRPLGNTGLHLSTIGLGGHWPTSDGRRYEDSFTNDEVPAKIVANRTDVVSVCLDVGINYIDITTAAEALAYGQALQGRRDRFIIGADDYQWSARNTACITVEALTANVERCLARLRTDYLDIWRVTAEVHGNNTDAQLDTVAETAARLKSTGKIRHLGVSSHHAGWLLRAVAQCPALELVLMPSLPLSTGGQVSTTASQRRLGIIGIKPFAGGAMFAAIPTGTPTNYANDLARLSLRWILQHRPEITCVVPGMADVTQVRNAATAADMRVMSADEIAHLQIMADRSTKCLPPEYAWLADWIQPSGQTPPATCET